MTVPDEYWEELEALKNQFQVGPTELVVFSGEGPDPDYPDDVSREDIALRREEPGMDPDDPNVVEEVTCPMFTPKGELPAGVAVLSYPEVARLWSIMPEDVRERERDLREEHGMGIPPVIQE